MKLKESNLNTADKYNVDIYPSAGIYKNTDENGNAELLVVSKACYSVVYVGIFEQAKDVLSTENNTEQHNVSEEFALKMLSIATKNDKYNEL